MSMINCTACEKAISGNAKACPYCGEPVRKPASFFSLALISLIAAFFVLLALKPDSASTTANSTSSTPVKAPSAFSAAPWMEPFDHSVLTKDQTRAALKDKYLALYSVLQPSYNHMKASVRRHGKGHALWIEHSFFNKYEYEIGNNSIAVRTFIGQHTAALKHAGIVAVGARNPENDDWTGYEVK